MSAAEATRFVTEIEADPALCERLVGLANDPDAVYALVRAEGFDCTPDEIKQAFLEAHGHHLTTEQLDAIAGGLDTGTSVALGIAVVASAAVPAAAAGWV